MIMARTSKTNIKIQNSGVALGLGFDTLNLLGSLSATDSGNSVAAVTGSGGSGANVASEVLTPTASGSNITLDLTGLAHTFIAVEIVFKNGQALQPTVQWSLSASTVTVLNSDVTDIFEVQYTF